MTPTLSLRKALLAAIPGDSEAMLMEPRLGGDPLVAYGLHLARNILGWGSLFVAVPIWAALVADWVAK